MTRLNLCIAAFLALLAPMGLARAEDRALIIGINSYPHLPRGQQLTGAVNDARAMDQLARDVWGFKPSQIKVLLDAEATSDAILANIDNWLVDGTERGDRIFFYYSGHGHYMFVPGEAPEDGWRETIAPYDTKLSRSRTTFDNMIVDHDIRQRLDALADRTVMFIADSCHSGTLWRSVAAQSERPSIVRSLSHSEIEPPVFRSMRAAQFDQRRTRRAMTKPAEHLIAWSAVQPTELAEEDMELGDPNRHGVFTRRFIEGLRQRRADRNADGAVSVMELYGYVSEAAGQYCASRYCRSGRMTPMMEAPSKLIGLDLLAWRPPGAAPPASTASSPPVRPRIEPTNVLPALNAAGLKLELLPAATSRVGTETKVRLTSPRSGWLILLDVRDSGRVVQLFPSACAIPDRQVRAGATITVPDARYGCAFTANEAGSGQIVAIVAEDNVPLDGLLAKHRDLVAVPDPDAYLADLAKRLMQAWHGDERTRPTRWSLVSARYRVEP